MTQTRNSKRIAKMVSLQTDKLIRQLRARLTKERHMDGHISDNDVIQFACTEELNRQRGGKKI